MTNECTGCGRNEVHQMCPAYGTSFYLSGIPYTTVLDEIRRRDGVDAINAIYDIVKILSEKTYET